MHPPWTDPDWLPAELPTSGFGIDAPDATPWFPQTMMNDVTLDLSTDLLEPFPVPVHDCGRTSSELNPGPNHSFRTVRNDDPWNALGLEESVSGSASGPASGSASGPASGPVSFADRGRRPQSTSVAQRPRDVPPSDLQSMATSTSAFASRPPQTYPAVSTDVVPRALQPAPVSDSALLSSRHPRRPLPPRSRQRPRQSPLAATLPFVFADHACSRAFRTKGKLTYASMSCRKHRLGHDKPFRCGMVECHALAGFRTTTDLIRHRKSIHQIHGPGEAYYLCAAAQCQNRSKSWPRLDNFRNHVRRRHPDENLEEIIASSRRYEDSGAADADLGETGAGLAPHLARPHSDLPSIDSRTRASSALAASYVLLPSARSEASGPVDDVSAPWSLASHAAIHHTSASGRLSVRALRPGQLSGQALDQATREAVRVESGPATEREMAPSDLARPVTTLPSTPGDVRVDEDRWVHPPDATMLDVLHPMPADIEPAGGPTARAPLDVSSLVQRLAKEALAQLLTAVVHHDRHQAPSVAGSVESSEPWPSDRPRLRGFSDELPAGRRPLDRSAPPSGQPPGLSIDLESADVSGRTGGTEIHAETASDAEDGDDGRPPPDHTSHVSACFAALPCRPSCGGALASAGAARPPTVDSMHASRTSRPPACPCERGEKIWKSGRSAAAAREQTLSAPRVAMSAAPRPARTGMDRAATSAVDASQFDILCAAGTWVISTARRAISVGAQARGGQAPREGTARRHTHREPHPAPTADRHVERDGRGSRLDSGHNVSFLRRDDSMIGGPGARSVVVRGMIPPSWPPRIHGVGRYAPVRVGGAAHEATPDAVRAVSTPAVASSVPGSIRPGGDQDGVLVARADAKHRRMASRPPAATGRHRPPPYAPHDRAMATTTTHLRAMSDHFGLVVASGLAGQSPVATVSLRHPLTPSLPTRPHVAGSDPRPWHDARADPAWEGGAHGPGRPLRLAPYPGRADGGATTWRMASRTPRALLQAVTHLGSALLDAHVFHGHQPRTSHPRSTLPPSSSARLGLGHGIRGRWIGSCDGRMVPGTESGGGGGAWAGFVYARIGAGVVSWIAARRIPALLAVTSDDGGATARANPSTAGFPPSSILALVTLDSKFPICVDAAMMHPGRRWLLFHSTPLYPSCPDRYILHHTTSRTLEDPRIGRRAR
ncbi:MAG: hypothetical protein M1826_006838 [Phylliscum demangeonii]|nr:MAG: hypothetical protein M1826_006838 [Phylliscum demangeonii]